MRRRPMSPAVKWAKAVPGAYEVREAYIERVEDNTIEDARMGVRRTVMIETADYDVLAWARDQTRHGDRLVNWRGESFRAIDVEQRLDTGDLDMPVYGRVSDRAMTRELIGLKLAAYAEPERAPRNPMTIVGPKVVNRRLQAVSDGRL